MFNRKTSEKQRWSLRKLTIGMASIMLGTTLFVTAENTLPALSNSHVVMADEDPLTDTDVALSGLYGLNDRVSRLNYVGHHTKNLSNGGVQDVYVYRVFNNNVLNKRLIGVKGIFGMFNNAISITFQACDSKGNITGSIYDPDNWSDPGAANETAVYVANIDEGKLSGSQNLYVSIYITRANPGEVAGFKDIVAVSQGEYGSTRKPQISNETFTKSNSYNGVLYTETPTTRTGTVTVKQQVYSVNDNPVNADANTSDVPASDIDGFNKDQVAKIKFNSGSIPNTASATTSQQTVTATVTYTNGDTATIDVPYIVVGVNDQKYARNATVPDLTPSDVAGIDSTNVQKVEWVTKPNTSQNPGKYSDATAKITFTDGTTKDVPVTYTITITPNIPPKTPVDDITNLTQDEKDTVKKAVEDANKGNFPENTEVTIGNDGTATIKFPDGTETTIPGTKLVVEKTSKTADITIKQQTYTKGSTPASTLDADQATGTGSQDIKTITLDETPDTSEITSSPKTVKGTVTFNDGSSVTVDVPYVVTDIAGNEGKSATVNKQTYNKGDDVPDLKPTDVAGIDPSKVTKVEWENKPNTNHDVGDYTDATAKITFTDGSTKEVPVSYTVVDNSGESKGDTGTTADKITPAIPDKTEVGDKTNLTPAEKETVKGKVEDANKDVFPQGTEVTIGNDGTATIKYPDGSIDTIPGSDLVVEKSGSSDKSNQSDADKINPNIPAKTPVDDPKNLTPAEKEEVKNKVEEANKGNFPDGTKVEIGNDGTATITYPDGSKDTISGDQLVKAKDSNTVTPNIPDKVLVNDPSHLTDAEREKVKDGIIEANKGNFPDRVDIEIAVDGKATITFPDGTKIVIPAKKLVAKKSQGSKNSSKSGKANNAKVTAVSTNGDKTARLHRVDNNKRLPQTGSNEAVLALIGAGLISLASLMGFKKKED